MCGSATPVSTCEELPEEKSMTDILERLDPAKFVDVDLSSEDFRQNFMTVLSDWARKPPFYVLQNGAAQLICARYGDMAEALSDTSRFSSEPPQSKDPRLQKFMPNKFMSVRPLTQIEGEQHTRLRRLINPAFSPASTAKVEPLIGEIVDCILDELEEIGPTVDAMADFAAKLMPYIMLEGIFRFTPEQRRIFVKMNHCLRLTTRLKPGEPFPQEYTDSFAAAQQTIDAIVAERRANPGDDLISELILETFEGDRLNDRELFELIFVFGAGAIESTAASMGAALLTLCRHPDQFDELKRDPTLIPAALEECMRYHGPGFMMFTRYAQKDTELGGTPVPEGMPVYICHGAAGLDPVQYPDPLRFDIHRNPPAIPTFGGGIHFCVGNRLARAVLRAALTRLLDRFPHVRLADPAFRPHYVGAVSETQLGDLPMRID
jgi:cytochrome P450